MRTLLLPALAAAAIGCSKPAPPTLTPEQASLTSIDTQGIGLTLTMSVTNPNSADLSASGITSHVVVDKTHELGTVTLPKTMTLPAGQTTTLVVPVSLKWTDMGVLAQIAATTGGVPYSVDGTLDMGGKLLQVGVPFHLDGTISHEQIVGAAMKSLPKAPW
ncbi:MAG: LEA type 2 family protein [Polyangiaceae bacterium]